VKSLGLLLYTLVQVNSLKNEYTCRKCTERPSVPVLLIVTKSLMSAALSRADTAILIPLVGSFALCQFFKKIAIRTVSYHTVTIP
jgi:hypothetical protein